MIEIKGLTKKYGKAEALSDFNLTIPDGCIFGLVGINGAGKSTLLRLISGVFKADEGEILIDGENVFENEKKKKEIFFCPDELFYVPSMTATKMVEFYKTFYDFDDNAFYSYIRAFNLNTTIPVKNYSKGMKRQLFVCLAFASSTKYLFLDEVFDGLDPSARLIFKRGLVDFMARSNGTVVIASHSLRELEDICDSYGLIDGKKIKDTGTLSESLGKIFKFQIAFDKAMTQNELGFECVSFESSGRIVKIVVKGEKEEYMDKISALNPLVIDEIPVDFEEFFISEMQDGGKI